MTIQIIRGQGFLDPGKIDLAQPLGTADYFIDGKALIAVSHDFKPVTYSLTDSRQPCIIF